MRLLLVTYNFPPFRSAGAVRTGQTAKYLTELGHDVRVVTADSQPFQRSLPLEIAADRVVYTRRAGLRLAAAAESRAPQAAHEGRRVSRADGPPADWMTTAMLHLRPLARPLVYLPEYEIGWYPYGLRAAIHFIREDPVDLIFASAWPITSLFIAATAAKVCRIPWVAELRDLWSDNHYRTLGRWQRVVDQGLERRVLGSASGLVTVTRPWAEALRRRYDRPVCLVYNGFEWHDSPHLESTDRAAGPHGNGFDPLVIVYLGALYGGKRDPTPLFRALSLMGNEAKRVRLEFYGCNDDLPARLARAWGLQEEVSVFGEVSYAQALALQASADVLLLLMWDTPAEVGVMPGKLFEYMGSRRPILAVGAGRGVTAELIASRRLGLASSNPAEIARQLSRWIAEKGRLGRVEALPSASVEDFCRRDQVRILSDFLGTVAGEVQNKHQTASDEKRRQ